MADRRKLQGEVDRVLKKVAEGAEAFQDIWQKVQNANNTNQKDKYEAELKREIKKLQRLREQIKTWAASSDIKDKKILLENRRLIEQQMEKFRIVEKETKTKAYSKEGLGQASKVDPAILELERCAEWINDVITRLTLQIDTFEAEIESLHQANRKKKLEKDKQDRVDELHDHILKHRHHITQLEHILRKLDNESLEAEMVNKVREDVEYYIDNCLEPDYDEDEGIYDELELDMEADVLLDSIKTLDKDDLEDDLQSSPGSSVNSGFSLVSGSPASKSLNNSPRKNSKTLNGTLSSTSSTPTPITPSTTVSKRNLFGNTTAHVATTHSSGLSNHMDLLLATTLNSENVPVVNGIDHFADYSSSASTTSLCNFLPTSGLLQNNPSLLQQNNVSLLQHQPTQHQTSNALSMSAASFSPAVSLPITSSSAVMAVSTVSTVHHDLPQRPDSPQTAAQNAAQIVRNHVESLKGFSGFNSVTSSALWKSTDSNSSLTSSISSSSSSTQPPLLDNAVTITTTTTDTQPSTDASLNLIASSMQQQQQWTATENSSQQQQQHQQQASPLLVNVLSSQNLASVPQLPQLSAPSSVLANTAGVAAFMPIISSMVQQPIATPQVLETQPLSHLAATGTPPPSSVTGIPSATIPIASSEFGGSAAFKQSSLFGGMMNLSAGISKLPGCQPVTQEVHLQPVHGVAPLGPVLLTSERLFQLKMLEAAYHHLPQKQDSERMRPYFSRSAVPIASYHHHQPPANIDSLDFFLRLSPETLFFIFYYQEGTRAQYLAAKALKKQSWRFHTKYMMWFQRHEEPKRITDEYEEGTYIFFDYEKWSQRKRDGFTFEYRFLEDKDLP